MPTISDSTDPIAIPNESHSVYNSLEDFGLSSYEAKVYYAMLGLGFSTAREVSNRSAVPFGRIYDVLSSLEDKGIIEKQDSRPKKFTVKEPKFALNNLLIRKKKELDSLTSRARGLETALASMYAPDPHESMFWSVGFDKESIYRHFGKLEETEEELQAYVNTNIGIDHPAHETKRYLGELYRRGIQIKLILGGITSINQIKEIISSSKVLSGKHPIEVRYTSISTTSFDIIDGEKVILKIGNPANPLEYLAAIYMWQKRFATELKEKFFQMWKEAKEVP